MRRFYVLQAESRIDGLMGPPGAKAPAEHCRLLQRAEAMSGFGRWRLEVKSNHMTWSDEVYRIHGVDKSTFNPTLGEGISFFHPDDRHAVGALLDQAISKGDPYAFQRRLVRPNGQIRHVICQADCELDPRGAVLAVAGVIQDVTDQVLDMERIRRSEAKYRLLADNMGDVIARFRLDGSSGYVSPAIQALLGFSPEDLKTRPPQSFVHPDDRPLVNETLSAMSQGLETATIQYRALHRTGQAVWVESRLSLLPGAAGGTAEIVLVIRDISERKAYAAALAASEARYRLLTENAKDLIVELDRSRRFVYASPSIHKMIGRDPQSIIGSRLEDLAHPQDRGRVAAAVTAAMAGDAPRIEYRLLRQDGSWVWIESRPTRALDEATRELVGVTDVIRDVTERKAGEAALEASEARYRELADNASDMIAHCTLSGLITFVSAGCWTTLGYTAEELIGRRTFEFMHPEDVPQVQAFYIDLCRQGPSAPSRTFEFRAFHKDGRCLWLEGRPKVFFDTDDLPLSIQDVARDITERKQLELELERARTEAEAATAIKSEFLANMSHELRTPLTSILGFSGILAEEGELTPHGRRAVERVRTSSQALLALVDDILDFSKLSSGRLDLERHAISPAAILRETLALLEPQARQKKLELVLEETDALPPFLYLDETRLRQILVNLVGNGVKFTSAGQIRLGARYDEDRARIRIDVRDTGMGIAADRLDRLFKKFSQLDASTTRAFGGTGLGLAICKGLVEAMGGTIGVESTEGEGARFWFEVPCSLVPEQASLIERPTVAGFEAWSGLRILLAGLQAQSRQMVRLVLHPFGVDLLEAASADEAQAHLEGAAFDIILLDGCISGPRTASFVHALRDGGGPNDLTPVIGLFDSAIDAAETAAAGFDSIIAFPLVPQVLLEAVNRLAAPYIPLANEQATYG